LHLFGIVDQEESAVMVEEQLQVKRDEPQVKKVGPFSLFRKKHILNL